MFFRGLKNHPNVRPPFTKRASPHPNLPHVLQNKGRTIHEKCIEKEWEICDNLRCSWLSKFLYWSEKMKFPATRRPLHLQLLHFRLQQSLLLRHLGQGPGGSGCGRWTKILKKYWGFNDLLIMYSILFLYMHLFDDCLEDIERRSLELQLQILGGAKKLGNPLQPQSVPIAAKVWSWSRTHGPWNKPWNFLPDPPLRQLAMA